MLNWLEIFRDIGEKTQVQVEGVFRQTDAKRSIGRGAAGDITRVIDKIAEDVVLKKLKDVGNIRLVSEEVGEMEFGNPAGTVIVDPLDGSSNAKDGIPLFSISLAFAHPSAKVKDVKVGYVRNLITADEYHAVKGKGSYLNNERIRCTNETRLSSVGCELSPHTPKNLQLAMNVMNQVHKIRCFGSVALDVCFVAQGALSGYFDLRDICRLLDVSAALLILNEAGGCATDDTGGALEDKIIDVRNSSNLICAQNSTLHGMLLGYAGGAF
jgi:myo-inositol-1(or 4)-monophosphatase